MVAIHLTGEADFPGHVDRRLIQSKDFTMTFADLGAGASDSILLSAMDFEGSLMTNFIYLGCGLVANPEMTGEADLTVVGGFEGGDTNGLFESTAIFETGDNVPIAIVAGVVHAGTFFAAMTTWALLFGATELNDVSAGSLTFRVFYLNAFPV
jgi:hypothetical protein